MVHSVFRKSAIFILASIGLYLAFMCMMVMLIVLDIHAPGVKSVMPPAKTAFITVMFMLLIAACAAALVMRARRVSIDSGAGAISVRNLITFRTVTYSLDDFEGYTDKMVKSPYGDFKVIYLIRDGRKQYMMSGNMYANMDALERELAKNIKRLT